MATSIQSKVVSYQVMKLQTEELSLVDELENLIDLNYEASLKARLRDNRQLQYLFKEYGKRYMGYTPGGAAHLKRADKIEGLNVLAYTWYVFFVCSSYYQKRVTFETELARSEAKMLYEYFTRELALVSDVIPLPVWSNEKCVQVLSSFRQFMHEHTGESAAA